MKRWFRRWAAVGTGCVLLCLPASGAPPPWVKLETRNFTIYTQGNERKARDKAIEFERFIAGLDMLFPQARPRRTPLTIVLFDEMAGFQDYAPVVNNVVQPVGGYFTRLPHRGFIALPLEGENAQVRRLIFHEGVHWYFSFLPAGRPLWFDEGIAEVLSTFELRRREDLVGRAVPDHVLALNFFVRPPLAEMLQAPRESIDYNEATRAGAFYALAWAFVHYVLFGQGGEGSAAMARYLYLLDEGRKPAEAFTEAFGTDYAGMEERLYTYLKSGRYGMIRSKFDPTAIDRTIRRSVPDAAEIDLTLAYLSLVANRRQAAAAALERVRAVRPDDVETHEAWGLLEISRDNMAEARAHFARAVGLGSRNFICYFALASAQVGEWRAAAIKPENVPAAAAREVAYDLQRTINLEPLFEPAYDGLAEVLITALPLTLEDRRFLEAGARRFPRNAAIELGMATFDFRVEKVSDAYHRLESLLASGRELSPGLRDRAENLRQRARVGHRLQELENLVARGELAEAEAGLEEELRGLPSYTERLALLDLRQRLSRRRSVAEAVAAHGRGEREEARRHLDAMGAAPLDPADVETVARLRRALGGGEP